MMPESRQLMELFVEKAEKLTTYSYFKHIVKNKGTSVTVRFDEDREEIQDNFPSEESIDALVLTARMFQQNNDPISLANMASICNDDAVSEGWKTRFIDGRAKHNAYLDSKIPGEVNGKPVTRRELVDVFFYGYHAHSKSKHRSIYEGWKSAPIILGIMEAHFHATLFHIVRSVDWFANLCRAELDGTEIPILA